MGLVYVCHLSHEGLFSASEAHFLWFGNLEEPTAWERYFSYSHQMEGV